MYIPKHYKNENDHEAISFMQKFSFATMVTAKDGVPNATHLPFVVSKRGDEIVLTSHFARANPQAINLTDKSILTIFSEPHAYVSPSHYDKKLNVPTWNYMSVHAYGKAKLIEEEQAVFGVLEDMINSFESEYMKQWKELPAEYKSKMARGIVAFEIVVADLQFKEKLSQNKSASERSRITETFARSADKNERELASFMKNKLNK